MALGLARHAPWRHLLHSWLAQSKLGWSAQACTKQAQSAIDGARRLVWPEPKDRYRIDQTLKKWAGHYLS